jgi:hypothetical protein
VRGIIDFEMFRIRGCGKVRGIIDFEMFRIVLLLLERHGMLYN